LTNDNKIIDKYRKVELDIKYENKEKRWYLLINNFYE
jgi:hypothetical protein